jgi:hypothetical protein
VNPQLFDRQQPLILEPFLGRHARLRCQRPGTEVCGEFLIPIVHGDEPGSAGQGRSGYSGGRIPPVGCPSSETGLSSPANPAWRVMLLLDHLFDIY